MAPQLLRLFVARCFFQSLKQGSCAVQAATEPSIMCIKNCDSNSITHEGFCMVVKSLVKFIANSPVMLMLRIGKLTKEYSRVGFVLTAISEGIYDILNFESVKFEEIQKSLKSDFNPEGLRAWLDLGVSIGELKKDSKGYGIKGKISKELSKPSNDTWRAYLQARAEIFYGFIVNTPAMLRKNQKFKSSESYGELFARSSRTLEPVLLDVVDKIIPANVPYRLLEVGCGSGIYIKRACELNSQLTALGLELQQSVADFAWKNIKTWNLEDRVSIKVSDIREYQDSSAFDLVTFYNLIYYFPVSERTELFAELGRFLKPGGDLVLTTLCQGKDVALSLMNLWTSMTEGYGSLPYRKQIHDQLKKAGYLNIKSEVLIPSFVLFRATKK